MPRKLILLAAALSVLAAACAPPIAEFAPQDTAPEGPRFLPQAVDVRENAGVGLGLAVDAQGSPNISYFRVDELERIPPAPIPADPKALPAVMLAGLQDDLWVRDIVAQESARGAYEAAVAVAEAAGVDPPERPDFPEGALPPKFADVTAADNTDVAVDGEGDRHVVWTNGNAAVQYATDAGLGFANGQEDELVTIFEGDVFGVSIAATEDGQPWVAFYDGTRVMAVTRQGDGGLVEPVFTGATGDRDALRTDIAIGPDGPVVAFGTGGATMVARRGPDGWGAATQADPNGGFGVSLALVGAGEAVTASLTEDGDVRVNGDTVAENVTPPDVPADAPEPPPPSTGLAVDEDGNTWVAWSDATGVKYASSDDDFESREMPAGLSGANPHLAAGRDGPVAAWYSFDVTSLNAAPFTDATPPLAVPSPPAPIGGGAARCEPEGDGTQLTISAPVGAASGGFDKDCLATLPGQAFTVEFVNDDEGVDHNWSLYTDDSAAELLGGAGDASDVIAGPETTTYDVDPLEVGEYFYRCDLHPVQMTGTLVAITVEGGGGGDASPEASPSA